MYKNKAYAFNCVRNQYNVIILSAKGERDQGKIEEGTEGREKKTNKIHTRLKLKLIHSKYLFFFHGSMEFLITCCFIYRYYYCCRSSNSIVLFVLSLFLSFSLSVY